MEQFKAKDFKNITEAYDNMNTVDEGVWDSTKRLAKKAGGGIVDLGTKAAYTGFDSAAKGITGGAKWVGRTFKKAGTSISKSWTGGETAEMLSFIKKEIKTALQLDSPTQVEKKAKIDDLLKSDLFIILDNELKKIDAKNNKNTNDDKSITTLTKNSKYTTILSNVQSKLQQASEALQVTKKTSSINTEQANAYLKLALEDIKQIDVSALPKIKSGAKEVGKELGKGALGTLGLAAKGLIGGTKLIGKAGLGWVTGNHKYARQAFVDAGRGFNKEFKSTLSKVGSHIKDDSKKIGNALKKGLTKTAIGTSKVAVDALGDAGNTIKAGGKHLLNKIDNGIDNIKQAGKNAGSNIKSEFKNIKVERAEKRLEKELDSLNLFECVSPSNETVDNHIKECNTNIQPTENECVKNECNEIEQNECSNESIPTEESSSSSSRVSMFNNWKKKHHAKNVSSSEEISITKNNKNESIDETNNDEKDNNENVIDHNEELENSLKEPIEENNDFDFTISFFTESLEKMFESKLHCSSKELASKLHNILSSAKMNLSNEALDDMSKMIHDIDDEEWKEMKKNGDEFSYEFETPSYGNIEIRIG